jgi:hypothetical protein
MSQRRPNAAITADNVVTLGLGDHGAGSREPNGYQAVSSQRAIGVGNLPARFESSPGHNNLFNYQSTTILLKICSRSGITLNLGANYRGFARD